MRKTTLIIGIVAGILVAFLSSLGTSTQSASADAGPHVATGSDATPDKCASCHRIHTGQNEYLLKEAGSVEAFCYSCHGTGGPGSDLAAQEGTFYGGTTPGFPYSGKTASDTVGLRAGGFDAARINTTDPSVGALPETNPSTFGTIGVLAATEPVVSQHAVDNQLAIEQLEGGSASPPSAVASPTTSSTPSTAAYSAGPPDLFRVCTHRPHYTSPPVSNM